MHSSVLRCPAVEATEGRRRGGVRTGLEVQAIDVLGENIDALAARCDLCQCVVRGVWLAAVACLYGREHVLGQPELVPPSSRVLLELLPGAPLEQRALPD